MRYIPRRPHRAREPAAPQEMRNRRKEQNLEGGICFFGRFRLFCGISRRGRRCRQRGACRISPFAVRHEPQLTGRRRYFAFTSSHTPYAISPAATTPSSTGPYERAASAWSARSEEHTSELQSRRDLVCRLLLEKKKKKSLEKDGTLRRSRSRLSSKTPETSSERSRENHGKR